MFLKRLSVSICLLPVFYIYCQNDKNVTNTDTIKRKVLDEVVVIGQLRPESIKKSVFDVKVITSKEIQQRGANNLADVLNQTLNVSVYSNSSSGKSEINVFGLGGRYFKVLVDNIPIVNEEGFGNNTDLTTINLDDIERIELVEGAMGVQYGTNALSGVLNIVTKKRSRHKWEVNAYMQEETVGKEFKPFVKGKHIQSFRIGRKISEKEHINVSFNRTDFRGYLGEFKGKYHMKIDGLRGFSWLPKIQNNPKLMFSHRSEKFSMFYKFDYLHENLKLYDKNVSLNSSSIFDLDYPSVNDKEYNNQRFFHHLNFNGFIGEKNYDISFSFQKQEKNLNGFTYYIKENRKENEENVTYLDKQVWFSRGTLNNIIDTDKFILQAGYEITTEKGYGASSAIKSFLKNNIVNNVLNSYEFFASGEIDFNKNLSLKPGIRTSFSNGFGTQMYYSTSIRQLFKNNWETRAILGFGTTTPTYDQLYAELVDFNHDIRGNRDLNLEKGITASFHLKKTTQLNDDFRMQNKMSLSYLDIKDRIELIVVNPSPVAYKYNNTDKYTTYSAKLENRFWYKNLNLSLGGNFFGISKYIDYTKKESSDKFDTYSINANTTYQIPNINTFLSMFYKYNGKTNRFVKVDGKYNLQTISAYSMFDATVKKHFFKKKFDVTFGVRNIFDVYDISTNGVSGGVHQGYTTSVNLGYGRSYFLKLTYNLKL